jgi:glucose dehydrogenase
MDYATAEADKPLAAIAHVRPLVSETAVILTLSGAVVITLTAAAGIAIDAVEPSAIVALKANAADVPDTVLVSTSLPEIVAVIVSPATYDDLS